MSRRKFTAPATLTEAHDVLARERPKLADKPLVWAAFHRLCAEVYAQVAKTDMAHERMIACWEQLAARDSMLIEAAVFLTEQHRGKLKELRADPAGTCSRGYWTRDE